MKEKKAYKKDSFITKLKREYQNQIADIDREIQSLLVRQQQLYEDYVDQILDKREYIEFKRQNMEKVDELRALKGSLIIAVSYTHLDVYKRQDQGSPHDICRIRHCVEEFLTAGFESVSGHRSVRVISLISIIHDKIIPQGERKIYPVARENGRFLQQAGKSVSYTHLQ